MKSSIALLVLVTAVACGGSKSGTTDSAAATASSASTPAASATPASGTPTLASCAGTYTQSSPSFSPKFVFNADGTGEETQAASQGGGVRKFTWALKGTSQVTITFPVEGSTPQSTDWNMDCANGTFASLYKKS